MCVSPGRKLTFAALQIDDLWVSSRRAVIVQQNELCTELMELHSKQGH